MRIRIPLPLRRKQAWSPQNDQMEPLHKFFFLNIGRDRSIFFGHWGVALTVRFGIAYA